MPTSSPRIGFTLPIASEGMSIGDGQLEENYRKADIAIGCSAGTSFPASPFTGKVFRRTDQSKTYYWNGSVWIEWTSTASSLINGLIASATSVATGATGTTEALGVQTSFSAVQNRRYLIKASIGNFHTGAVEGFIRAALRWGTSSITGSSTLIREFRGYEDGANTSGRMVNIETEFPYTAVNQTIFIGLLYRSEDANQINTAGGTSPDKFSQVIQVYDYGAV